LWSDRSGATAVEFALLSAPFFLLIFALFGTGLVFLGELTLDNAVAKLGRQVRTGEIAKSQMSEASFRKALCDATYSMFDCTKLKIDVRTYPSYAELPKGPPLTGSGKSKTLDTSKFGFTVGTADTIMAVQVYYEWPIFISPLASSFSDLSSQSYLLGSVFAFKTEPFNEN
jgi:Flp pilus assembly protein TadG